MKRLSQRGTSPIQITLGGEWEDKGFFFVDIPQKPQEHNSHRFGTILSSNCRELNQAFWDGGQSLVKIGLPGCQNEGVNCVCQGKGDCLSLF